MFPAQCPLQETSCAQVALSRSTTICCGGALTVTLSGTPAGTIPSAITLLTQLRVFNVAYNSMSGALPDGLKSLKQIRLLHLAMNNFSGEPFRKEVRQRSSRAWISIV